MKKYIRWILPILLAGAAWAGDRNPQPEPVLDNLRGIFLNEDSGNQDADKGGVHFPGVVFQDNADGNKYAVSIPAFAAIPIYPGREYGIEGIVVQKHLPEKAKNANYKKIVWTAWPDLAGNEINHAAKGVKKWVEKNPDKPLLLVNFMYGTEGSEQPVK
jgi:hypothetical protein